MSNQGQAMSCPLKFYVMGLVGDVAAMMGVAGNVASTIMTNNTQERMFHQAQQFNANESAKQRQFVLEQWQRENEYNSPKAQIARLIAAGINPALAYTEGSLANTAAPSSSPSEANSPAPPHLTAPQVDPLTLAKVENLRAKTDKTILDSEVLRGLYPSQRAAAEQAVKTAQSQEALNRQMFFESASRIGVNEATAEKLSNEAVYVHNQNQQYLKECPYQLKMIQDRSTLTGYDVEYYRKNAEQRLAESRSLVSKYLAEAKESLSRKDLNDTQKSQIQQHIDNYQHTLDNIDANTRRINNESDLTEIEASIRKKYGKEEAEERIKKLREERITGYINCATEGIHSVGSTFIPLL